MGGGLLNAFLISELDGGERSASLPGLFTLPGKEPQGAPGTHWLGGWLSPKTGLDDVERRQILPLPGLELRPVGRPAADCVIK
jgi:hypothetical protein